VEKQCHELAPERQHPDRLQVRLGCPCNVDAPPTHGDCEGGWIWSIDAGEVDGVNVNGRAIAVFADWPGAIHDGGGQASGYVDDGAEAHLEMVLPEGLVVKRGGLAASKTFRVHDGIAYDHSNKYAAFGAFNYSG